MLQNQSAGARKFRAHNVVARDFLLKHNASEDVCPSNLAQSSSKARDTIYCPGCQQNHSVFTDQGRQSRSVLRRLMFNFYTCKCCEKSFSQAGLPLVLAGSFLTGAGVLMIGALIRSQF